jgi:hypothetical protein
VPRGSLQMADSHAWGAAGRHGEGSTPDPRAWSHSHAIRCSLRRPSGSIAGSGRLTR